MSDENKQSEKPEEVKIGAGAAADDDLPPLMSEEELAEALGADGLDSINLDAAPSPASPLEALAAENNRQEAEITDLKDQLLRSAAEMENLRRRTQKDIADARNFSISSFARDMLSVGDNLRRAIDHVDDAHKDLEGFKGLIEGVEMTERELLNNLEKNGVKKLDPKGDKFDPNFHQAMFEVQNPDVPNNTVVEVVQTGYVIGERVLRP
ncbi:MAG: nucleotide exchange factor GrpE, partial [Pseudomonadota bacterium]